MAIDENNEFALNYKRRKKIMVRKRKKGRY